MLNTSHSLTDGLQGFWPPIHGRAGGSRLYDLSAYSRHGTLTDTFASASPWEYDDDYPWAYLGPFGSDSWIDTQLIPATGSDPRALMALIRMDGSPSSRSSVWGWGAGGNLDRFAPYVDGGASVITLALGGSFNVTGTVSVVDGTWHTLLCTSGGTVDTTHIYIDGVDDGVGSESDSLGTGSGAPLSWGMAAGLNDQFPGNERPWTGDMIPVASWGRHISPQEVAALHDQARRGFPALLRRRSDVGLLEGGGGAADTVSLGTGTALADGFDPTITTTANTVSLGIAQAAAQGFSATVTATQNTVAVGTAQATAQGFATTITADPNTIAATTGQAAAQGFDPVISEGAVGDTLVADLGTAQAQGFAPSISTNPVTVTLGLGQAPANAFDPDVVTDPFEINTGQGQAAATGFDPTVTTNARTVTPQLGTAQADGFEPAVGDGTVGVATTMEIEARPLYEIDVEVRPLYRIRLFVKEQLP